MQKALLGLLVLAALAVLAYPVARLVDAVYGADVILLSGLNDELTVAVAQESFDETLTGDERRAEVVAIYGTSQLETERVLVLDDARVIRPAEDSDLVLLPSGAATEDGYYPPQTQSLDYVGQRVTLAGAVAIVVLLLLRRYTARKNAA